jgi:hypothetical protein
MSSPTNDTPVLDLLRRMPADSVTVSAIAPIVGTARVASATGKIVDALDVVIEVAGLEGQ